jgi:hypothetical protein
MPRRTVVVHTTHNPKIEGLNPACHWHRERENVKKFKQCVVRDKAIFKIGDEIFRGC